MKYRLLATEFTSSAFFTGVGSVFTPNEGVTFYTDSNNKMTLAAALMTNTTYFSEVKRYKLIQATPKTAVDTIFELKDNIYYQIDESGLLRTSTLFESFSKTIVEEAESEWFEVHS